MAQARDIPNPADPSQWTVLSVAGRWANLLELDRAWVGTGHRLQFAVWEKESWKLLGRVAEGPRWVVNWADYPTFLPLPGGAFAAHWLERAAGEAKYTYGIKVAHLASSASAWKTLFAPECPREEGQYTGFCPRWSHS